MNKIALIGDLHFGVKNFDDDFLNECLDTLENMAKVLKEQDVDTIIQLGDMFDNRICIDLKCIDTLSKRFPKIFEGFNFITLTGNHDMYYKNERTIVTSNLFKDLLKITVINEPTYLPFGDYKIGICPWLVDNESFIKDCDILLGHGDLNGSKFDLYNINTNGISIDFSKYKKVFMGHYHFNNGAYLGTPYQINFKEFGSVPGILILDKNLNETFVENTWSSRHFMVEIYSDKVLYQYTDKKEEFKGKLPDFCRIGKIKVLGDNPKTEKIIEYFCSTSNIIKIDYQTDTNKIEIDKDDEKAVEAFDFINSYIEKTGDEKLIEIFKSITEGK